MPVSASSILSLFSLKQKILKFFEFARLLIVYKANLQEYDNEGEHSLLEKRS